MSVTAMSVTARPDVVEFFDRYQQGANTVDPDVVRGCFAETFLHLDPASAGPVPREALIQALPGRAQLFAGIGVEALQLTELGEQPLDDLHTMVATTWSARFSADAADPEPLVLPSQFLLRRHEDSWRIVAYLNSTDLAAAFAQRTGQPRGSEPEDGVPATGLDQRAADEQPQR
jgi:hypothetical protein